MRGWSRRPWRLLLRGDRGDGMMGRKLCGDDEGKVVVASIADADVIRFAYP